MITHLERVCPERTVLLSRPELLDRIRACAHKAQSYGINIASQVASFTQFLFEEGIQADKQPEFREILTNRSTDQFEKVDRLWKVCDGEAEPIELTEDEGDAPNTPMEQESKLDSNESAEFDADEFQPEFFDDDEIESSPLPATATSSVTATSSATTTPKSFAPANLTN